MGKQKKQTPVQEAIEFIRDLSSLDEMSPQEALDFYNELISEMHGDMDGLRDDIKDSD